MRGRQHQRTHGKQRLQLGDRDPLARRPAAIGVVVDGQRHLLARFVADDDLVVAEAHHLAEHRQVARDRRDPDVHRQAEPVRRVRQAAVRRHLVEHDQVAGMIEAPVPVVGRKRARRDAILRRIVAIVEEVAGMEPGRDGESGRSLRRPPSGEPSRCSSPSPYCRTRPGGGRDRDLPAASRRAG